MSTVDNHPILNFESTEMYLFILGVAKYAQTYLPTQPPH